MSRALYIPSRGSSLQESTAGESEVSCFNDEPPSETGHSDPCYDDHNLPDSSRQSRSPSGGSHGAVLDSQRQHLVKEIVEDSRRGQEPLTLDDVGRAVFEAAGFGDRVDRRGDLEVRTRWLKPVVHEHVRHIEHTEYRTEVTRDIHRHHVFPKIQPISDPDPIILPTRHRIFSHGDGHWHEVVGDEAAIEILGEDVFLHGPKILRIDRRPTGTKPSTSGSRVIERERVGGADRDWSVVRGDESAEKDVSRSEDTDEIPEVTQSIRTMHVTL